MTRLGSTLVLAASLLACAQGETEPGVARDNCLRRDCGAAIGGNEAALDEDTGAEDDTSVLPDTSAPADTASKPDTTTPTDVGSPQCDPINPTKVCGSSKTCLFSSSSATTCAAAGTSTTAGSCASDPFTCAPGYVCVGPGDCRRWCRIGFAGDCPTGKTCGKLTTAPTSSGIEYGVCTY